MKGHKYELEKKRRQHTIEQKMAAMEEMVKEYRVRKSRIRTYIDIANVVIYTHPRWACE